MSLLSKYLHFSVEKPKPMLYNPNDLYVCIEVNHEEVDVSKPMTMTELSRHVTEKYGEQPLKYFNEHKRIKIIHLKTGDIKYARVDIVFG